MSIYGFSQAFWLNLITLWKYLKISPWFKAFFKLIMWMTYSALSYKLVTGFSTFLYFIKVVSDYEVHVNLQDI